MVNILTLMANYSYQEKVYLIIKDVEKTADKAVYVSLNKTYKSLIESLKADNIDTNRFFFIDTISATVIDPKPVPNCMFLPTPDNVKALYKGIVAAVKSQDAEMLIFDSLSSLTTYENSDEIIRFVTTLLGALSLLNCSAIFTCLKSDEDTPLIQHVKMKVEKVMEMS